MRAVLGLAAAAGLAGGAVGCADDAATRSPGETTGTLRGSYDLTVSASGERFGVVDFDGTRFQLTNLASGEKVRGTFQIARDLAVTLRTEDGSRSVTWRATSPRGGANSTTLSPMSTLVTPSDCLVSSSSCPIGAIKGLVSDGAPLLVAPPFEGAFDLLRDSRRGFASGALYERGFSVRTVPSCAGGLTASGCSYDVIDSSGLALGPGGWTRVASITLDLRPADVGTVQGTDRSYLVYRWPAKMASRSFDELGAQMREYSKLVGTLLHKAPSGPGELSWTMHERSQQYRHYTSAAAGGSGAFCEAVVTSLVDNLLPEGSEFLQYGNCGEGGRVGACLALKAGFSENEIRVCSSDNDHFFGMVRHPTKKWCILDRWPLVNEDNFACDVDWDENERVITHEGEQREEEWFQDVTCIDFGTFIRNGARVP